MQGQRPPIQMRGNADRPQMAAVSFYASVNQNGRKLLADPRIKAQMKAFLSKVECTRRSDLL